METTPHLIWDRHTRLFHWALVLTFSASMITGLSGEIDWMEWHLYSGYGMLGLITFRLLTGILGRDYGHFSRFPIHPRHVKAYARGEKQYAGHNPMGSWMVIIMLMALAAQALSGLLTTDDFLFEGPWVYNADEFWISLAGKIHHNNWILLLTLVASHIIAVLVYRFGKRQDLITPMVTGKKWLNRDLLTDLEAVAPLSVLRLTLLLGSAAGLTWAAVTLP